jgi:hypothetical protein
MISTLSNGSGPHGSPDQSGGVRSSRRAATSMMESSIDAMRHFWWQSSGSVDLDHAVLAPPPEGLLSPQHRRFAEAMYNALSSVIAGARGAHESAGTLALRDVVPYVASCGPHSGPQKTRSSARKDFFNSICQQHCSNCVSAAVRVIAHSPAVAAFQKRNRNPAVGRCCCAGRSRSPIRHAPS